MGVAYVMPKGDRGQSERSSKRFLNICLSLLILGVCSLTFCDEMIL